jgi:hypothetical protein
MVVTIEAPARGLRAAGMAVMIEAPAPGLRAAGMAVMIEAPAPGLCLLQRTRDDLFLGAFFGRASQRLIELLSNRTACVGLFPSAALVSALTHLVSSSDSPLSLKPTY